MSWLHTEADTKGVMPPNLEQQRLIASTQISLEGGDHH
jgi:hypothetical protein